MSADVLRLEDVDPAGISDVGGKAAQLGALLRIEGVRVPAGFCVTTAAYRRVVEGSRELEARVDRLRRLDPEDRDGIRARSAELRRVIEGIDMPEDLVGTITRELTELGDGTACAVRSSATAEDLPTASFAGQQDTYLNVVGAAAVADHVRRCWASLFTERAVTYRMRNGIDHRAVRMAVVVQRMVVPEAAGVLFTADPVTSDRRVASIEAVLGLGEPLVSGTATADAYRVRDDRIASRAIATKERATVAHPGGGTTEQPVAAAQQELPALTDEQVVELARLGRRIEAHLGHPQDIEWCLDADGFHIVQSRPITTLFPVPGADDDANRVYISVGHQQMMTDAMRPLGLSVWQLTAGRPMHEAGGRLFVDVTHIVASPATRAGFLDLIGRSDPLIRDGLETVLDRDDFLPSLPDEAGEVVAGVAPAPMDIDPTVIPELIARTRASVEALARDIRTVQGEALFDFIVEDIQQLRRLLFDPQSTQVIMAAMQASWWLDDRLQEWLGEKGAADTLTLSVPHNVTSEMGFALLDVADVIRRLPEVVAFLRTVEDDGFLDELLALQGGAAARDAICAYLDTYGMRCVGEIDITRPRWAERPTALLPLLLADVEHFDHGAAARLFEEGRDRAQAKEREVLERLRSLPDGDSKADEAKRKIDVLRTSIGYREHPKYGMVSRYLIYKRALLAEGERLVRAGVLAEAEDIFELRFDELREAVRTSCVDHELIRRRKAEHRANEALTPPRVLTSDGEALTGAYRRDDLPPGALAGLAVSAGTVEGRARVVLDMATADLAPGDILVTRHTDPSWSPLFVAAAGLVTEVGGLMTHGAVVAREYGLPAVVGVEGATHLIEDGQRIRVDGTDGYVELLPAG
ncbi:MAG TPA: rifamycin-inactivating phosphotransferase [Acidimicrobiales bacterium]|nr:rifamycin-inactivating phosphotransferase [Acidimicrobiales bacterium]